VLTFLPRWQLVFLFSASAMHPLQYHLVPIKTRVHATVRLEQE
jgi:hypothetical protein